MHTRLITRVIISANSSDVFRYLGHLKYHYLWNPHLRSIAPITKVKLGTQYKTTSVLVGIRVDGKITVKKLIQDKEFEAENNTGTLHYNVNYRLKPQAFDSTTVTCAITLNADSHAITYAGPVLKQLVKRELQTDLQALKVAVENELV